MTLTQDKIASLRKLTALSGGEMLNIDGVLDSFASLASLDTTGINPSSRSGASTLVLRSDEVHVSEATPDRLLQASPQRVVAHQIALTSIMQGE